MAANIAPATLAALRAHFANIAATEETYWQDASGMWWTPTYFYSGAVAMAGESSEYSKGTATAITGWRSTPSMQPIEGQTVTLYREDGTYESSWGASFGIDTFGKIVIGMIALFAGGAALAGAGGAGAGVAGDAFMPGALGAGGSELAYGAVLPGLESYVVGTAAATGATAGAVAAPGAGASLSGLAGTATKIIGALGTVLGIAQQASDDLAASRPAPIERPVLIEGIRNDVLVWGAVGVAALAIFSKD